MPSPGRVASLRRRVGDADGSESVRRRKPPWCSYEPYDASASRAAVAAASCAAASGVASSRDPRNPSARAGSSRAARAADGAARRRQVADERLARRRTRRSCRGAAGSPETQSSLSWNESASGSSAGRDGARGGSSSSEVEEARQRRERALVRLLLGEEPQHRLGADQADREPVGLLARLVVRADELDAGDGLELARALVEHQLDVRERLEPRAEARLRAAHALRDGADPAAVGVYTCRTRSASPSRNERSTTASVLYVARHRPSVEAGSGGNRSRRVRSLQPAMARIQMYTTRWCGYCVRAKALLDGQGHRVRGDLARRRPAFRRTLFELTGGWTVPQILIDGEPIGGYTELWRLDARRARRAARRLATATAGRRPALTRVETVVASSPRGAGSAGRTTCRGPPRARLLDRRAAAVARLAGAAVDLELVLHRARRAVGQAVVARASSPGARCRASSARRMAAVEAARSRRRRGSPAGRSGWSRARQSASSA